MITSAVRVRAAVAVAAATSMLAAACSASTRGSAVHSAVKVTAAQPSATASSVTSSIAPASTASTAAPSTTMSAGPNAPVLGRQSLVRAALAAGAKDLEAATSYDYRHLDASRARGSAAATGSYRAKYLQAFTSQIVPEAPKVHAVQVSSVSHIAVSAVTQSGTTIVALAFGQLDTSTTSAPHRKDAFSAGITVQLVGTHWLIADLDSTGRMMRGDIGNGPLTEAGATAANELQRVLSIRRGQFDTDYQRTLDGATGAFRADLQARKASVRSALTQGHFDLTATEVASGIEQVTPGTVRVLASFQAGRLADGSTTPTDLATQRLEITVRYTAAQRWQVENVTAVGVS